MKLLALGFLNLPLAPAFAGNRSFNSYLKVTEVEVPIVKELRVRVAEAVESGDREHLEALTAQARNVMVKQLN